VILAWPILLVVATILMWRNRDTAGGRGRGWFGVWVAAGFLMSFSLVTGFSIGIFILPLAAAVLIWVAHRAPHLQEAVGFLGGVAATALVVAVLTA
jgi:hypothetical protein